MSQRAAMECCFLIVLKSERMKQFRFETAHPIKHFGFKLVVAKLAICEKVGEPGARSKFTS